MDITRVVENPSRLPLARFTPWLGPEAASRAGFRGGG